MIIRNQKTEKLSATGGDSVSFCQKNRVLSEPELRFEIAKEISRSNRRNKEREFALIVFPALNPTSLPAEATRKLQSRIRITDTLGGLNQQLAILLPETDRDGAMMLANDLSVMLGGQDGLDNEILVYPWDDQLIAACDELESDSDRQADVKNHGSENGRPQHPSACTRTSAFTRTSRTPWWKRATDIAGAGAGLVLLSPIFLLASAAIRLTSPGPVFFRQLREGKDGEVFGILKFRTMVHGAESRQADLRNQNEQDGPAFKIKNDPRITPIGRYLRKSCVDELPQLINVLMGEMSLVGPRPLPIQESYECTPWQRARLTVLPGLTCTWQARGGRDTRFDDWMRMDLDYIRRRSFVFDLRLIVKTAWLAVMHRGSV